jgi:hypothetical protein
MPPAGNEMLRLRSAFVADENEEARREESRTGPASNASDVSC